MSSLEEDEHLGGQECWDFQVPSKNLFRCAVVSIDSYPWWEDAAWSFGAKVERSISVRSSSKPNIERTDSVTAHVNDEEAAWKLVQEAKVKLILVEGAPPTLKCAIWKNKGLKLIVTTKCRSKFRNADARLFLEKDGWIYNSVRVRHRKWGGVTDREDQLHVFSRKPVNFLELKTPKQDLRSILKAGLPGKRAIKLSGNGSVIGAEVIELKPGVFSSRGLLPHAHRTLKVRTVLGGEFWVDRVLTLEELLMAYDIREHLIRQSSSASKTWMARSLSVPQRSRHAVGRAFKELFCEDGILTSLKRSRPDADIQVHEIHKRAKSEEAEVLIVNSSEETDPWDGFRDSVKGGFIPTSGKALKSDNASVPSEYWNKTLLEPYGNAILTKDWRTAVGALRGFVLRVLKRNVTRSYITWKRNLESNNMKVSEKSVEAARDAVGRYANSSWWKWNQGSRALFWRWPAEFQEKIRDGIKLWLKSHLKPYTKAQASPRDQLTAEQILQKLSDVRAKGYVEAGVVKSLITFFHVDKGQDDIRMVYDGTKSGLNESLWAPWFPFPTIESMLRAVEPGTYMSDNDVGEMFLNFMLHEEVRELCGVDFTLYFPKEVNEERRVLWERWSRCAMGLRTSPYQAIQAMMWAKEVIMGDRHDPNNVFRWQRLVLNLPGMPTYDPSRSWICKVREDGTLACDLFTYCDDNRITAPNAFEAWKASQKVSSTLGFLGLQDAPRKRRYGQKESGAWAGSVVHTSNGTVVKLVSQERWNKTLEGIRWMRKALDDAGSGRLLHRKKLESWRGFLIYVGRTYSQMKPYFRGIHATLDGWRPDRDEEGWKLPGFEFDEMAEGCPPVSYEDAPEWVRAVPRLDYDLIALEILTAFDEPPRVVVRASGVVEALYGFGDASGLGFGSAIQIDEEYLRVRVGTWAWTIGQEKSSNWRELKNLVESIHDLAIQGRLRDKEVFLMTDNTVAERAFFKGTSKSRSLFELVLELRKLELVGGFKLHVVHVAGTRLIETGIDGLSRGDDGSGVMAGIPLLSFVPLHLSATERQPGLVEWLRSSLCADMSLRLLEPDDWANPFSTEVMHLWAPPPAAADYAVELMAEGIHKRPDCYHVFVVPRLMTVLWQKMLGKCADLLFSLPAGSSDVWDLSQHEPLTIAVMFPLSSEQPWKMREFACVREAQDELRGVLKGDSEGSGNRLRKLLVQARTMGVLQTGLVREVLRAS